MAETDELLTTAQVAKRFRVHRGTVIRWANEKRLRVLRTPGGSIRFYSHDVEALIERNTTPEEVA